MTNCLQLFDVLIDALSGNPDTQQLFNVDHPQRRLLRPFRKILGIKSCSPPKGARRRNGANRCDWVQIEGLSARSAVFFARSYAEVLADSWPKFLSLSMEDQLALFLNARHWAPEDFVRFAKFATVWPMARYMQNAAPVTPENYGGHPTGWSGRVKRYLKNRLVVRRLKHAKLFWSILQGVKRGADVVSEDFCVRTMRKHRETLSTPPTGRRVDTSDFDDLYERTAQGFRVKGAERLLEATTSATCTSKRSAGGGREELRRLHDDFGYGLSGLIYMIEVSITVIREVRGVPCPTFNEVLQIARGEGTSVMVHPVIEPLKCRLITKGNTYRYWLSRFFQRKLWHHLFDNFVQFSPIGRPLREDDLYRLLDREKELGINTTLFRWVSGDYSGATDGLSIQHTKAAFEAFLRLSVLDLRPGVADVLRSVLYEQELWYPKNSGIEPVDQKNGQLMGSTLSFPILCVVNLATYWKSLEEYSGREYDIHSLPVLINGDDILFRADDELYSLWKQNSSDVGFELSLGKNYIHERYLTMNSQLYDFHEDRFTKIEFFNTGLLTGDSFKTGRQGAREAPIWDIYDEAVRGATDIPRAHRRFLHYHSERIRRMTQNGELNLFVPREFGGLGFKNHGVPNYLTSYQKRLGTILRRDYLETKQTHSSRLIVDSNPGALALSDGREAVFLPLIGPLKEDQYRDTKRLKYEPILCSYWEPDVELIWTTPLRDRGVKSRARKLKWDEVKHTLKSFPFSKGFTLRDSSEPEQSLCPDPVTSLHTEVQVRVWPRYTPEYTILELSEEEFSRRLILARAC